MSTASNASSNWSLRPAGTTLPDLPKLSSGHTRSSLWSGRPPGSISSQPAPRDCGGTQEGTSCPEKVESASTSPTPHGNITVCCPEHGGREVELYCETCGETICLKCIMKGQKHHSHDYEELNEAFERYKGEIMSSLEPMEKQLATIVHELVALIERCPQFRDI